MCRDTKTKYRDKVKASKVIVVVDDAISVSSSSSATPADYFGLCPPPPGIGLRRKKTGLKRYILLLVSMDPIPLSNNVREAIPEFGEIQCSSCKVIGNELKMFWKCWTSDGDESFFKTCDKCRDTKKKKKEELRVAKLPVRKGCSYSPHVMSGY